MMKYNKQRSFGRDENGKRIVKWFHADTLADLEKQVFEYKQKLFLAPQYKNYTFKQYADLWFETHKFNQSKQTQDMYRNALNKCKKIYNIPLENVSHTLCQNIISEVWNTPSVDKNVSLTLKQIFKAAVMDGILVRNPAEQLSLPRKPKSKFHLLTDKELQALDKANLSRQDRMFVTILKTFGLRPGEALALTVSDFDSYLHITKSLEMPSDNSSRIKETKNLLKRDIPIPSYLMPQLASYFADLKGFLLFPNKRGTYYTKSSYRKMCKRILKEWNIALGGDDNFNLVRDITMYSFRHRRATDLFYLTQQGVISILQASELMGHSVNMFLNTYSHIDLKRERLDSIYDISVTG